MPEDMEAVHGDPFAHEHKTAVFVGEWRAFADCTCGWKTKTTVRYYSPILDYYQQFDLRLTLSNAATDHEMKMNGFWWRLKRALREGYEETTTRYGLGKK